MYSNLHNAKPTLYLCVSLFILQAAYGFGSARGNGSPGTLDSWHVVALYWALSWWFINDSRRPDVHWSQDYMDMGLFIYVAGFFMIPYYLFKSRGWKAFYTIGLFLAIYIGAFALGAVFSTLLSAF